MAGQERLSVNTAAERLGITPDAVRSRIKRGTLWAIRRHGRVQVVLKDPPPRRPAAGGHPTNGAAQEAANGAAGGAVERLRGELAQAKRRLMELRRERDRLLQQLERQQGMLDREFALREGLQKHLDRLSERLVSALPETKDDPVEGADQLWRRLEKQIERMNRDGPEGSR
ncbi:MAG: hypothetical protein V3T80_11810 [Kiloniellales bacterium]